MIVKSIRSAELDIVRKGGRLLKLVLEGKLIKKTLLQGELSLRFEQVARAQLRPITELALGIERILLLLLLQQGENKCCVLLIELTGKLALEPLKTLETLAVKPVEPERLLLLLLEGPRTALAQLIKILTELARGAGLI